MMVGKQTSIEPSDKTFDVETVVEAKLGKKIRLHELADRVEFQHVMVAVKAIHVKE